MKIDIKRGLIGLVAAVGLGLVATGCTVGSTAGDEVAVHFGGGPTESKTAKGCVDASDRDISSVGDTFYYYPANQRTFDFNGKKDSDSGPISVISKDNQTLTVPGQLNFDLNTKCDVLTAFHNNIGKRYHAYMEDEEGVRTTGAGWIKVMNLYIGRSLDATLDRVAKNYNRDELFTNPAIKTELQDAINTTVQQLVDQQTDGDQQFFQHFSALIGQPDPGQAYRDILTEQQQVVAQAKANEAKAVADARAAQAAANAQVAQKNAEALVAKAEARAKAAEIAPYGSALEYNRYLAIQKGLNPYQPSYGTGPLVTAPSK